MRVLIVGAGVGGLTLAAMLSRRGIEPVVVERAADFRQRGYVLALWPNGGRVLDRFRISPPLCERGLALSSYVVADNQGRTIRSMRLDAFARRHGPTLQLHRAVLHGFVREAASGVSIRMGVTVDRFHAGPASVGVELSDGSREVYDLVVGADGLRSRTRAALWPRDRATFLGASGWAFLLPASFPAPEGIVELWGPDCYFGLYPYGDGRCAAYCVAGSDRPARSRPHGHAARLRELFADFGGPVPEILDGLGDDESFFYDDVWSVQLRRWHAGRVVLLGDAAHGMPAFAGMGASMALEDAQVLTEVLTDVVTEGRTDGRTNVGTEAGTTHLTAAFQRYERRRKARVLSIQRHANVKGIAMTSGPWVPPRVKTLLGICPDPVYALRKRLRLGGDITAIQSRLLERFMNEPV